MSSESELSNSSTLSPKQRPSSKSQKASLTRIVKAQVTLLISNLNNDNFTRKSTEIRNLIETHGQDIGEHLFRYLLSDIYKLRLIQDGNSPQLRLLKENAQFTTEDKCKSQVLVTFASALEQFCKSDVASQVDLLDLLDRLELDAFDKLVVCIPLFSGVKKEISDQAKVIFSSIIENALSSISNIKSIPNNVVQYFYDSIANALSQDAYQFDFEKLQSCVNMTATYCSDKSIVEKMHGMIHLKYNSGNQNDQQFKQTIIEMYNNNSSSVARILDMTKELDVLPAILDSLPPFLALDLASLADYRKCMNLESWLKENLKDPQRNVVFVSQCLDYLGQKIALESQRQEGSITNLPIPLSLESMSIFLKALSESPLTPQQNEAVREIQTRCLQVFPKLMNVRSQAIPGSTGGEVSFKPDVEEEANLYYERIYNGELSIESMIELLQRLHSSKDAREQDVFACMIHNLFDEYSFFPKYPDKELSITSILFGSLIQHRLVSYVPLGIALRYIWDALRNPVGSKMFNFGVQALKQFQDRLSEWPQYCSHLLQIPDLAQAQPDLVAFIQAAMNNHEVRVKPGEELDPNANQPPVSSVPFTSVHVPQTPSESTDITYIDPTDSVQDKILFIINNVARNNINSKVADLVQVLKPSSFKWFSHYLVVKRASSEPNYHELYILVLDSVNSKLLYAHVLSETYANILILLNSEKTVSNSSERTLLKNLGSWLGRLTLAKNKPILHKYIAFKNLLLEGYDTQRLIVVIPFVCKVLEHCAQSVIFRPPNPWLMAILKLLVELYEFADLKLNLKFEIEVLCKNLSLELKDIVPTTVLKTRQQPQNQISKNAFAAPGAGYPGRASAGGGNPLLQNADAEAGVPGLIEIPIPVPNLAPYIAFNSQIPLYSSQPAAKRLVLQAFTESIREIIGPVVERAVAIAVVSTRDLVSKDFVTEMDENKMRKSAHMMAQNLAASLAMVTSKEPLRLSIVANLRSIFLAHGLNDNMAEQAIILTVADNLDLMCAVIEKAAMEKATMEIDEVLSSAFASRKKHREQRPSQPFVDMETYQMPGFLNTLPQPLRPKPNGLQPAQLAVYEDFMRIPRATPNPSTTSTGVVVDRTSASRMESGFTNPVYGNTSSAAIPASVGGFDSSMVVGRGQQPLKQQQQQGPPSAHMILERFAQCIAEIETLTSQTNVNSVNALPQHSDIRTLIRQIPMLAMSNFDKAEAARTFAQKVVQLLYKSEKQLTIEVYVVILEHLCEVSPNVGTLVTSWLTHADDERKYNVPVTVALIKAGLINLPEQDQELSILIDSGRTSAIEFTARLIRACLFGEYPLATRHEFMASLEALGGLRTNQLPDSVLSLLEDMRKAPNPQQQLQQLPVIQEGQQGAAIREQLQFFFAEWVRLYQHPATTEKTMLAFATQLSQQSIFKVEDISSLFYRVCIEASVEHAIKFKMMPGQSPELAYQPIDALSKLIVCLVQVPLLEEQTDRLGNFTRALNVVVLCMSHHHELRGQHFDQRPFLRFFTCILSDLHAVEQNIQSVYIPLLTALSNTLYTLQPSHFTGFTFAWLQLISHRLFMPQLLLAENQQGWPAFQRLLVSLLQFLAPYLRNAELRDTTRLLYRGTLRVLLVLLHDFPEFLCDYHYSLCDVIPSTCIQMRNLILSAFPRNMRLPDPFTSNLKIDLLPEIHLSPRILSDFTEIIENQGFKKELDQYLDTSKTGLNHHFLKDVFNALKPDKSYNVPLLNALVLYIGTVTTQHGTPVHQGPAMEIYQYLLSELDSEGRYLFLSAIANQLRYPNSHTHYFSCVLLYLFVEGKKEIAKEQITRVLLERLIVNRPHPWGLLITFIELIKNPHYSFWGHSFTRCATDIERLFESVSRSINQN